MKPKQVALQVLGAVVFALGVGGPSPVAGPSPQPPSSENASVRILFGETQSATRVYDGSLSLSSGSVVRLVPYRFFQGDAITGSDSWKLTLKRVAFDNRDGRPNSVAGGAPAQNVVPAGVTATLSAPESARVAVRTAQGNFDFVL